MSSTTGLPGCAVAGMSVGCQVRVVLRTPAVLVGAIGADSRADPYPPADEPSTRGVEAALAFGVLAVMIPVGNALDAGALSALLAGASFCPGVWLLCSTRAARPGSRCRSETWVTSRP